MLARTAASGAKNRSIVICFFEVMSGIFFEVTSMPAEAKRIGPSNFLDLGLIYHKILQAVAKVCRLRYYIDRATENRR
jgi:hypothetical protein